MIPRECKRLAEVDFPIAVVSKHAAREKSIRHGHPSTLHLWWARRPLASSRAVLLALLLPDPCDPNCPEEFKRQAGEILSAVRQPPANDEELQKALLWFIGAFANWDMASHPTYLQVGRNLVKAAHGEEVPLVVDPFAGGGSIPLEALRLGCEAFASDLNPVACLILKVMLEDIPRHGPALADELRRVGGEIKAEVQKELADLYPLDPDGATPIAYLWARTVRCEAPNCGAEIPLMRSFWLCKKARRKRALRAGVVRANGETPRVEFEIFEPRADNDVRMGTVARANATCICCGAVVPPERVRAQLVDQRGGADIVFDKRGRRIGGARLTAVVALKSNETGRHYRLPADSDYAAANAAQHRLAEVLREWERGGKQGLCPVPDEPLPLMSGTFNVPLYGIKTWGDLFTARQKMTLIKLAQAISTSTEPVKSLLAIALDRTADGSASVSSWLATGEEVKHVFTRQALPIVWDFGESNYLSNASRTWASAINSVAMVVSSASSRVSVGQAEFADATSHPLPDQSTDVWFTDPPYYFAVPYADLSDFFFVWLKRVSASVSFLADSPDLSSKLTPKNEELCEMAHWDPERYSHKDQRFFEDGMAAAFAEGRRVLSENGVGSVIFAHKTTEGWEALLAGLIRGGWTITGSWPIATEMATRLRARDSAALATSIHLVCRPRPEDAVTGDWADILRELPRRAGHWMERLQAEGIRGADLVFACVGPALEVFSRYSRVETADGREVGLAEYLEKVWEVVGRTALENVLGATEAKARNGLAGAMEEDARLTALFLWTLQATEETSDAEYDEEGVRDSAEGGKEDGDSTKAKGFSLVFDVVRRFAQPLGIDLPQWEKRTIETKKGVVRLLPVTERAKQLFGEQGPQAVATWLEQEGRAATDPLQGVLFPDRHEEAAVQVREQRPRYGNADDVSHRRSATVPGTTTLDRVHTGMLLQAGGRTNALRALVQAERQRGPDFLRLANALSALYPRGSEEKRLLDAMLLVVPR